ncbi:NmrA family NAD(P)-binding protein [Ideonella sp. B508-1]|uniref:NmrA family NAD(P)-binding protein n=1 Tax=Ideonella sp. B508-1 TaxID=137716 RepID=UPI0003B7BA18|nr:NmrA family NAD(P)-binding protein [Ideonella sp. B508-1]
MTSPTTPTDRPLLVTGATGAQGGATARALRAARRRVRALVRDPDSPAARALAASGVKLARGDLGDPASLDAALAGVEGVFSVQVPDATPTDRERRHGFALVEAARRAGVAQFVHTSVCEAGRHTGFPHWGEGRWTEKYWTDKWDIEQAVRAAGFAHWTVLKPAFMMDNFAQPKARFMFPHLREGRLLTALHPSTRMQLIAAEDIGTFAAAAFARPAEFDRQDIDLAAEALTMGEVAAALSEVTGRRVAAQALSPQEALAAGLFPGWVRSQEWTNLAGYRADIDACRRRGIPLTAFASWARRHGEALLVDA